MKYKTLSVRILFLGLLAAFSIGANAEVKLPRLVGDGMVLQRNVPLKIWGWADPGENIKVTFLGKTFHDLANEDGRWEIGLPAASAGGPHKMTVNDIEIQNILIGDVWLSSGQSNMELPLRRVLDLYDTEIRQVNNTNIRWFRSSTRKDFERPQADYPDGEWKTATPENIMEFSAVAYFFADSLYQKYKLPIGIISTAIGGSPAESWLSEDKVGKYLDEWLADAARKDSLRAEKEAGGEDANSYDWWAEVNKNDPGVAKWSEAGVDVSGWESVSLPGYWNDQFVEFKKGSIWFYKTFEVPDSLTQEEAVLRLGRIIDSDSVFVNGIFVGTTSYQYPPRIYPLDSGILKPGKNELMVRVFSQGDRGGFIVDKPYEVRIGNQSIDLTGDWKYHVGAELNPPKGQSFGLSFRPGGLYNGLISPATGYEFKGVTWYQGESNAGRAKEYRQLFKDLIKDWRTRLDNPELPFLFVQLANLGVPNKQPVESGWARLRDAQRQALELPNTGMAVTYDIGEWNDIHPLNKKDVGHRLALEAFRVAYNDNAVVSSGPLYESMEVKENSIILKFSSVGSGLYTNNRLDGFQIAAEDGDFVWANAVVFSKNSVRVWSDSITEPMHVRYAWDGNPADANLKNKEGLPASPFSTEEW